MPHARKSDPKTSHDAAKSVTNLTEIKIKIIELLKTPMTDTDLVFNIRASTDWLVSESGVRTRRSELVELGLVIDSGRREKLASGRLAILWATA